MDDGTRRYTLTWDPGCATSLGRAVQELVGSGGLPAEALSALRSGRLLATGAQVEAILAATDGAQVVFPVPGGMHLVDVASRHRALVAARLRQHGESLH